MITEENGHGFLGMAEKDQNQTTMIQMSKVTEDVPI